MSLISRMGGALGAGVLPRVLELTGCKQNEVNWIYLNPDRRYINGVTYQRGQGYLAEGAGLPTRDSRASAKGGGATYQRGQGYLPDRAGLPTRGGSAIYQRRRGYLPERAALHTREGSAIYQRGQGYLSEKAGLPTREGAAAECSTFDKELVRLTGESAATDAVWGGFLLFNGCGLAGGTW